MVGKVKEAKKTRERTIALSAIIAASALILLPGQAKADYAEILGGSPRQTLRNPLIPGAPTAAPYQAPYEGQPPPVGDGAVPDGVNPGDMGGPSLPPSGYADPTHGNIFPTRNGQGTGYPGPYVPGAGRHDTQNGNQQGMFDFGQEQYGKRWGSGGKNGGSGRYDNGGPAGGASGMGPGGANGGTGTYESGAGNGGSGWINNGGPAGGASGMGPGGSNGGAGTYESGAGNGGTGWTNNGGPAAGASGMGAGGSNGGAGTYEGGAGNGGSRTFDSTGGNGGTGTINNGGSRNGQGTFDGGSGSGGNRTVNDGGNAGGTSTVNNGGPKSDAQGTGDRLFSHTQQGNRYDFQGPLPTVRTFSRYLVILGVVCATVFMTLAAWSMVFGSPYGASRVIGAAGGLILLLMGYTIWKVVQMNTFHANSTSWESHYRDGSQQSVSQRNGSGGGGPFAPPSNPSGP